MSVLDSKITIVHCFSPENHCFALFEPDLSGYLEDGDPLPSSFLIVATLSPSHRAFL